jgi:hypothetical protein
MLLAHYFLPHSTTNHLTSPSSAPFPCSVRPAGSALLADLASRIPSSLANLPGRIVFTCVTDWGLALGCSRPRLTAHALTLCFMSFHGLTLQDFHLR